MTKRDVRASALAKLAPFPGAVLWDIGTGSGAVSIDFLRSAAGGRAFAIDKSDEVQLARAVRNAEAHGVSGFEPVAGLAADGISDLPPPDAVFIGGGLSAGIIEASQAALRPGGVLVAHAVTIESESVLITAWQQTGGDLTRLSIQHADPVGGFHGWRPLDAGDPMVLAENGAEHMTRGRIFGVGTGPGDPQLVTRRAWSLIEKAAVIAYPAPDSGTSFARSIVAEAIRADAVEIPDGGADAPGTGAGAGNL